MSKLVVFVAIVYDPYLCHIFFSLHRYQRVVITSKFPTALGISSVKSKFLKNNYL